MKTWQRLRFAYHVARILLSLARSSSVALLAIAAGLHVLTGCAPAQSLCSPMRELELNAIYEQELMSHCDGYDGLANCPDFERLSAEDDARRKEFVECR